MKLILSPSPNFDSREGHKPEAIVIHCTDGTFPGDLNHLKSPASQVSSHYLIAPNGNVHMLVPPELRAWHAGRIDAPTAPLKKDLNPNQYTIGIEVSLVPPAIYSDAQKKALLELVKEMCTRYQIPMDRAHIWGHHEIYSRKTCPGTINVDDVVRSLHANEPEVTPAKVESREEIKSQIIGLLAKL